MTARGLNPAVAQAWTEYAAHVDEDPPKTATGLVCRWCVSVWLGVLVIIARRVAPKTWRLVARALALSSASTLMSGLER